MSGKINADFKSFKFIISRNKPYLFSIFTILLCIILLFQFVIPQFRALLSARKEANKLSQQLETLNKNFNVLANINENSLDSQLKILNSALPINKDFVGIINSINYASQKTGVDLGTFSIQIGDISESQESDKLLSINISVPVNADITAIDSFVETISNSVPLVDVSFIKIANKTSSMNLSYYYKPLGSFNNEDISISPLSQQGLSLINQLATFQNLSFSF